MFSHSWTIHTAFPEQARAGLQKDFLRARLSANRNSKRSAAKSSLGETMVRASCRRPQGQKDFFLNPVLPRGGGAGRNTTVLAFFKGHAYIPADEYNGKHLEVFAWE
jgi:hypothetical protein